MMWPDASPPRLNLPSRILAMTCRSPTAVRSSLRFRSARNRSRPRLLITVATTPPPLRLSRAAQAWAARDSLSGGGVVATVMSNLGLERFLAERNLKLERTAVGDRHVMAKMREGKFNLGGEASGHIILSDYSTTGDGLIAALQVLAEMVRSGKPMSALGRQFEPAPQKLENVRFAHGKPLENASVKAAIASAEKRLNGCGRVLVRASGTEPLIRIMAEGDDEKLVGQLVRDIAAAVKSAAR